MQKNKNIVKVAVWNFVGFFFYRLFLDWIYLNIISDYYFYMGFINLQSLDSLIISWIVLLAFTPFLTRLFIKKTISSDILILFFLVSFVPMTSLMRFIPMNNSFLILFILYWACLLLFYYIIPPMAQHKKTSHKFTPLLWIIIIILSVAVLFVSGYYFGFRINLDLSEVYDLRMEVRETNMPSIFGYLLPAAGNTLPLFLVYFLSKKNKMMVAFFSIVILLNFSIGGHKSILFKLILCFIGYYFFTNKTKFNYSFIFAGLALLAILERNIINTFAITSIGIRRVFFIPGLLNYHYYDFFSDHEPDYFRQSILRRMGIESPYQQRITRIIGEVYFGSADNNANNGLFSDAYSNLGIFAPLMPFLLVIILKLMDKYTYGIDIKLLFLPIIVMVTTFNSVSFFTGLLTGGIILLFVILVLFPRNLKKIKIESINTNLL